MPMLPPAVPIDISLAMPDDGGPFVSGHAVVYRTYGVGLIESIGAPLSGKEKIKIVQVSFPKSVLLLLIPWRTAADAKTEVVEASI